MARVSAASGRLTSVSSACKARARRASPPGNSAAAAATSAAASLRRATSVCGRIYIQTISITYLQFSNSFHVREFMWAKCEFSLTTIVINVSIVVSEK